MKRYIVFAGSLLIALIFAACAGPAPAPTGKDVGLLDNSMAGGSYSVDHDVEGEHFTFTTTHTTDYNTNEWHITDTKSLNTSADVVFDPGYEGEVLVEHVHYDVSVVSKYAMMNGVSQDSMDDNIHGGTQPGFHVTDTYPYENVFVIGGYTEWLTQGWGYYTSSYGYTTIETIRLTEYNLIETGGVTGSKIQIVFDLLIKNPGDTLYHTRSIIDEFIIPVGGEPSKDVPVQ